MASILWLPVVFASCSVLLYWLSTSLPALPTEGVSVNSTALKFPSNLEELQALASLLEHYRTNHMTYVIVLYSTAYLFKQAFAVPGSIFLNLLGGALFGQWFGFFLTCFLSASGATICFLLAKVCGRSYIVKYFPDQLKLIQSKIEQNADSLFFFLMFLRLFPMTPNWFLNMASPICGVPAHLFFLSVFFGLMPYNFISVQTGCLLSQLTSMDKVFTPWTMVKLFTMATAALVPGLCIKRYQEYRSERRRRRQKEAAEQTAPDTALRGSVEEIEVSRGGVRQRAVAQPLSKNTEGNILPRKYVEHGSRQVYQQQSPERGMLKFDRNKHSESLRTFQRELDNKQSKFLRETKVAQDVDSFKKERLQKETEVSKEVGSVGIRPTKDRNTDQAEQSVHQPLRKMVIPSDNLTGNVEGHKDLQEPDSAPLILETQEAEVNSAEVEINLPDGEVESSVATVSNPAEQLETPEVSETITSAEIKGPEIVSEVPEADVKVYESEADVSAAAVTVCETEAQVDAEVNVCETGVRVPTAEVKTVESQEAIFEEVNPTAADGISTTADNEVPAKDAETHLIQAVSPDAILQENGIAKEQREEREAVESKNTFDDCSANVTEMSQKEGTDRDGSAEQQKESGDKETCVITTGVNQLESNKDGLNVAKDNGDFINSLNEHAGKADNVDTETETVDMRQGVKPEVVLQVKSDDTHKANKLPDRADSGQYSTEGKTEKVPEMLSVDSKTTTDANTTENDSQ